MLIECADMTGFPRPAVALNPDCGMSGKSLVIPLGRIYLGRGWPTWR
jgi:hypothetical protein